MNVLKKDLKKYAKEINLSKIGFTDAEEFLEYKKILASRSKSGISSEFEEKNLELRTKPKEILKEAKSIISVALAYECHLPISNEKTYSKFSASSRGLDYHKLLKGKLDLIEDFLKKRYPSFEGLSFVDTGPLSDRAVAKRAGLGWIGKNNNLITKDYGSFVFLGTMITNIPFQKDACELDDACLSCNLCKKICPNNAILENRTINSQKCLSYLTQKKEKLSEEEMLKLAKNNYLYGCDLCQIICPYNKSHIKIDISKKYLVNLFDLLNISNRDFKKKFSELAGAWRGKKILQRNAILILAMSQSQEALLFLKEKLKKETREDMRFYLTWAIRKLENNKGC